MKKQLLRPGLRVTVFLLLLGATLLRMQSFGHEAAQFSAAKRFQGDTEHTYVQISCYWEAGQTAAAMEDSKQVLETEIAQAFGAPVPMRMAWGSQDTATAAAASHSSSVELYRVSGEFFSIYPFSQLAGSYQYLSDASAVLNEKAAWELFASTDCAGCSFSLDGAAYTVQGVCETKGSESQIYLAEPDGEITFCELLLPERWDGFAEGLVSSVRTLSGGVIRNNSLRLGLSALWDDAQAALNGSGKVQTISYPAWEHTAQTATLRLQVAMGLLLLVSAHLLIALIQFLICLSGCLKTQKKRTQAPQFWQKTWPEVKETETVSPCAAGIEDRP